jgi:hypothetical protein
MAEKRTNAPIAIAVLLLLPVLYVGSYAALVKRDLDASCRGEFAHEYRLGAKASVTFFLPIHWLDIQLRPRYWMRDDLSHYGGGATEIEEADLS